MIKVTFKKPYRIMQDDLYQDCLFIFCYSISKWMQNGFEFCEIDFNNMGDGYTSLISMPFENIQSIEHVKPNDL